MSERSGSKLLIKGVAAVAAVAIAAGCGGKSSAEGGQPGPAVETTAPAGYNPNTDSNAPTTGDVQAPASSAPAESDDGTNGTGDLDQSNGGTEGKQGGPAKSPKVFVLGESAGSTALFGCMKEGTTTYTFGLDYVEGSIKGATATTGGKTTPTDNFHTPAALQAAANANPDALLTGEQTIGGKQIDCGGPVDTSSVEMNDESGAVLSADLQVHQPVVQTTSGGLFVLQTGHA